MVSPTKAGIHQHPAIIGRTAVELLAGQIVHGEVGFGSHPRVTVVEGSWIEGGSLRAARARAGGRS